MRILPTSLCFSVEKRLCLRNKKQLHKIRKVMRLLVLFLALFAIFCISTASVVEKRRGVWFMRPGWKPMQKRFEMLYDNDAFNPSDVSFR
ncbi:unnamed protein product [Caenorhabditis auriculariae]|uniref:Uncharacterized protein n=1 Tax=Caenorhabditis auriculariae TaxID=2777116 RepID=A0A8S1HGX5_9PELO|nr:unnamed protein product [Caenorhabditis auriculariae]